MTDSYTAELREIIDRTFVVEYAGRATAQMVHNSAHADLPEHLLDYLVGKGLRAEVSSYFREKRTDGLPKRPEANDDGEHAQLELLSATECGYVYSSYRKRADDNVAQAEKVREFCLKRHGVDLGAVKAVVP